VQAILILSDQFAHILAAGALVALVNLPIDEGFERVG
jgi:hypothetical protein